MNLFKSFITQKILPSLLMVVAIIMMGSTIRAQNFNSGPPSTYSPWSLNVSGGTNIFFGDIKQNQYIPVSSNENEWRFGGGLQAGYQFSPILGLRLQGLYGQLAGTRRPSNLYFESNYIELNANATVSIRNILSPFDEQQMWDIYFILGVGITNYNTELMELNTKKVISKLGYGNGVGFGGRAMEGVLIGGLGLKIRLTNNWSLNLESAHRGMNSDLFDAREGGFKYDIYNYSSVGFTYRFGKKKQQQQQSSKQKKEEFDYFESRKGSEREPAVDDQPVQPAEIDMLFVAPPILSQPVEPPEEEKPTIVVVEEVVEEPQIVTPRIPDFEYRVQIRAKYGNAISIQKLSTQYNIPASEIKQNTYNGFYIYTIGSYPNYEAAREKRNQLRNYNGIVDAFVVAFKNGQRLNKLP